MNMLMKSNISSLRTVRLFFCLMMLLLFSAILNAAPPVPKNCRQMILVITPSPDDFQGKLYRFQRSANDSDWQPVSGENPVVVGKKGLGWGIGLHSQSIPKMPVKREGDGKSPAGVFKLSAVFGFAPSEKMRDLKMPYLHVSKALECVDDVRSRFYNRMIYRDKADSVDWHSSEKMRKIGAKYELGVFVDHNAAMAKPGAGSCIFLHIWGGVDDPTIGCTAMPREKMQTIVRWLDADKQPVLVQLTNALYQQFKTPWHLPESM